MICWANSFDIVFVNATLHAPPTTPVIAITRFLSKYPGHFDYTRKCEVPLPMH